MSNSLVVKFVCIRQFHGRRVTSNIDSFPLELGVVCWVVVCMCDELHAFSHKIVIFKVRAVRIKNLPQL